MENDFCFLGFLFELVNDQSLNGLSLIWISELLGGGNSNIFYFHPYLGMIPILTSIFQMG